MHAEDLPRGRLAVAEILTRGFKYNHEYRMVCKDGRTIEVNINSSALTDGQGRFVRTICIVEDITERKRLERQLVQSQRRSSPPRGTAAPDWGCRLSGASSSRPAAPSGFAQRRPRAPRWRSSCLAACSAPPRKWYHRQTAILFGRSNECRAD
jgi:hypothetical protein